MAVPVETMETDNQKAARTGTFKGRKVSEKKRKIGQVLAGSASVSNGSTENGLELDFRVENDSEVPPFSSPSSAWA